MRNVKFTHPLNVASMSRSVPRETQTADRLSFYDTVRSDDLETLPNLCNVRATNALIAATKTADDVATASTRHNDLNRLRNSPPAVLLRESYRVDGKFKKRTLLNLTDWPPNLVEGFRALLKSGAALPPSQDAPCRGSARHAAEIGLDHLLGLVGSASNRCRDLIVAMIGARLIAPAFKTGHFSGRSRRKMRSP